MTQLESTPAQSNVGESAVTLHSGPVSDRAVRAELEIERGGSCPVDDLEADIVGFDIRFQGNRCLAEAEIRECEDQTTTTKQFSSDVCTHCPGIVFSVYDCIPRFLEATEDTFVVETHLESVDVLSALVNDIRERANRVTVRSITHTGVSDQNERCSIDLSVLTPKQREAITVAQEAGYYDLDSSGSLGTVADRIGISKSALSQRLSRAEGNILRQLNCACRCWKDD
ncbi:helix-turn-helix domain-containing protein [Natrialbaceae archaeon A-CW2]|uniref:helix-turn-helix domain-containing protein n=1 Tax=Natronosalvus amylolyticus TaxID=2961994 RepID=UPI0020C9FB9A|nr:helix-turn-helix domain-containing protein [Natronosalvus amylolyticus]